MHKKTSSRSSFQPTICCVMPEGRIIIAHLLFSYMKNYYVNTINIVELLRCKSGYQFNLSAGDMITFDQKYRLLRHLLDCMFSFSCRTDEYPECSLVSFFQRTALISCYSLHCVPDTWSSDIWSFRLYGQFLAGPDFPIH